ncbi:uncharacterized protein LOC111064131 [Nilaparvata lugens]|uniref:uncharacterized protein LOC111064131 n=1 Tax=Nilaparvata lugens TaxID=108931 RepID=UPI000B981A6C|nr:uncharacterized protein LOC111064131 [Nilaparvata lugens]
MDFYLASLSIMLLAAIHSGASEDPLKCYSCSSKSNPECAEGDTDKLKAFEVECDSKAITAANSLITAVSPGLTNLGSKLGFDFKAETLKMACLKAEFTEKETDKKGVLRSCSVAKSDEKDWCGKVVKSLGDKNSDVSCTQCDGNLCNGSTIASPSLFIIALMSFISCLIVLKQ